MSKDGFIRYQGLPTLNDEARLARARAFADRMAQRRTIRDFSSIAVPRATIVECLRAAGQAPSGANQQPWHFEAISEPALKRAIRLAAEAEERAFYQERATAEWLAALAPLGTNAEKPFLEDAPWLIVVFEQQHGWAPDGRKIHHYYSKESVGLACGFLIAALHDAGLATLTHTPSPMKFLNDVLERPSNEKPFLLLVVGQPAPEAEVPDIVRKDLKQYVRFREAGY